MSQSFLFILAAMVVKLYFSVILIMWNPMHSASYYSQLTELGDLRWCKPLSWREPPGPVVALASFPGSGNTWLRYLLQQSTGIMTGSVYMDFGLYENGFLGEAVTDGSVLVVKTHGPPKEEFQAAILLIRDPRDAILAHFNGLLGGHLGFALKKAYVEFTSEEKEHIKSSDWSNYVESKIEKWESVYITWLNEFHRPLHIVFYEELVRDLIPTLGKILNFLSVKVTIGDLNCTLRNREGLFHRQKYKNFDPFTPRMMKKIDEVRSRVLDTVSKYLRLKAKIKVIEKFTFVSPNRHNHSRPHRHSQRTQSESGAR